MSRDDDTETLRAETSAALLRLDRRLNHGDGDVDLAALARGVAALSARLDTATAENERLRAIRDAVMDCPDDQRRELYRADLIAGQHIARAVIAEAALDTARADAWDQGYGFGHSNAMRQMSDEPNAPTSPNPYRAASPAPTDQEADHA